MTLQEIFTGIDAVRIGVLGDFCLDGYWHADMRRSELSREVPHFPLPVVHERYSPGAAGNVAANIAALKPAKVLALGVIGHDWRGIELKNCLNKVGVDTAGLIEAPERITNAYIKPLRMGISDVVYEDPRLDFENTQPLGSDVEAKLLQVLDKLDLDVLCVCDQTRMGVITPAVREKLSELGEKGLTIIVDSRDNVREYRHVIVKPNEVEAARAFGEGAYEDMIRKLHEHTKRPAIITLGDQGCMVYDGETVQPVPAHKVQPPIDICGAGDTFLSGLACSLAAGAPLSMAAAFGNAASAVTIRKLNTTGTATREELDAQWHSM